MPADPSVQCIIVLGGGGHARVVIDTLRAAGTPACGVLDANRALWGTELLGVPVLGGDEQLPDLVRQHVTHFVVGLGGVGDNRPRRDLFERGLHHGLKPLQVIHPSAVCSSWATIGAGSMVGPLAVVNAGATLGRNVIVNTGTIVEHDCRIADHVHLATGVRLSGGVQVGEGAHVGAGAIVRQGAAIGAGAIVGAGAVVIGDAAPGTVVAGVPARPHGVAATVSHEHGAAPR